MTQPQPPYVAGEVPHHPDCDGYRTEHRVLEISNKTSDVPMYVFHCTECGPLHVGYYGEDAVKSARRQHHAHSREVKCDGRCMEWT